MAATRLARTDKGQDEIAQGRKNLRGKLRTVLFLVDPHKTADAVRAQVAQLGAPPDAIEQLIREGYVVEVGAGGSLPATAAATASPSVPSAVSAFSTAGVDEAQEFRVAKAFMNDTIVDALGIRAFMFTLKLEKCATRADLAALVPDYTEALLKKMDRNAVRAIIDRTRELLGAAK